MHDAGLFWPPAPTAGLPMIETEQMTLVPLNLRQTLVSGDVSAGLAALAPGVILRGPFEPSAGAAYAVRLAPDRALLVEDRENVGTMESSWYPEGYAASLLGDGLAAFSLDGPEARVALAHGTGVDLWASSPLGGGAAWLRLASVHAAVYRHGPSALRLHVERGLAMHVWTWFQTVSEGITASLAGAVRHGA